jgi:hypothetical protein
LTNKMRTILSKFRVWSSRYKRILWTGRWQLVSANARMSLSCWILATHETPCTMVLVIRVQCCVGHIASFSCVLIASCVRECTNKQTIVPGYYNVRLTKHTFLMIYFLFSDCYMFRPFC